MPSIRITSPLLAAAAAALLAGCQASHLSQAGPHGPQCPAIQSAAEIGFSSDRAAELKRIASSPGLSEHEQEFLIDATLRPSGFSADRADVLVALAANPAMTQNSREYLAERARRSSLFSSDRARVTAALTSGANASR